MPIRDYECRVCHHKWEELRKDQTDPERCPVCKCDAVNRQISSHKGFNFANGASYHNDYKGK